ncbi:MAG: aspartyl protease family protein [Phycisphaeraceae bacterium]
MPIKRLAILFLALGLSTLSLGCRTTRVIEDSRFLTVGDMPAEVSVPLLQDRMYYRVPVTINEQDAGTFLLDTGAALIAADLGVVRRLELPRRGGGTAIGIAGREPFSYHDVDSLAVGPLLLNQERVAGLNMLKLHRRRRSRLDGLVGFPALAEVPFALDGPARELTFYDPDHFNAPDSVGSFRLIRFRNLPTVEATIGEGRRIWLVLDTGADEMLSLPADVPSFWPEVLATEIHGRSMNRGVGGVIAGRKGWVSRLEVFGYHFNDVQANFAPPPDSFKQAPVPVGRIGNAFLKRFRLTFDQRSGRMWAELDRTQVTQVEPTEAATTGVSSGNR